LIQKNIFSQLELTFRFDRLFSGLKDAKEKRPERTRTEQMLSLASRRRGGLVLLLLLLVLVALVPTQSQEVEVVADQEQVEQVPVVESNASVDALPTATKELTSSGFQFPHMFVLNLDRAPQRWSHMQTVMEEQGLQVERLSAVDGKTLTDAEMLAHSTKMAAFLQPRGVIGCYLSHKRFWQMVVDRNLDSAIIFEDDVRLVDDFKGKLQSYLQRLETEGSSYDVLLLGAIGRVHPEGRESFGSRLFSTYIGGKRPLKQLSNYLYKPRRPAGTHAYMVSNAGARRLLGLCPKATFHVDLDVSLFFPFPFPFPFPFLRSDSTQCMMTD